MLSSRAKIIFSRTSLLTLEIKYNNNEISVFAGIGFNTLAEIIGRLKTYYGSSLNYFFEKGLHYKNKKMPRKQQIKKAVF
jgi:hypothetical protein